MPVRGLPHSVGLAGNSMAPILGCRSEMTALPEYFCSKTWGRPFEILPHMQVMYTFELQTISRKELLSHIRKMKRQELMSLGISANVVM